MVAADATAADGVAGVAAIVDAAGARVGAGRMMARMVGNAKTSPASNRTPTPICAARISLRRGSGASSQSRIITTSFERRADARAFTAAEAGGVGRPCCVESPIGVDRGFCTGDLIGVDRAGGGAGAAGAAGAGIATCTVGVRGARGAVSSSSAQRKSEHEG